MPAKSKLTVRLPKENLDFLKRYAQEHELTVTEVLDRYLRRLRQTEEPTHLHPKVEAISGILPADIDAKALYHQHLLEKHR